jgi:hypothetical protein
VQLGARYDGSAIVGADGAPPPDSLATYTPTSVPGGRAPHLWRAGRRQHGDSLFDCFGSGFTLLRLGYRPPNAGLILAAARASGIPLTVLTIASPAAREMYQRDLVLIRPDQHVAWRGNHPPDDADALLALVTGR